ncbi:MAG: DUF456 domain-containing protein [Treponema sp.]|nr:DUF456 domain-containing protein [Treponema sp.]
MTLDVVLLIIAVICLAVGTLGTFVPVLPGAPLAWIGLLLGHWISYMQIPVWVIVVCAIAAIVVSVLDNVLPALMTNRAGGSKAGTWGCTIGLIAGFFIGPIGIILCPFAGALIGELINDSSDMQRVFRASAGAFTGFLLGTGLKLATAVAFIWVFVMYIIF